MRIIFILIIITCFLGSCKSSKGHSGKNYSSKQIITKKDANTPKPTFEKATKSKTETKVAITNTETTKADKIVDYAKQFGGVKYRFGGATAEGMDCSGLVFESFRTFDIILPRISRDMAKIGEKITLNNTQKGDLLFFKTMSRRNDISHVGLVVTAENGDIQFIHSTTQAGVIISKLSESYWDNAFVEARRIL